MSTLKSLFLFSKKQRIGILLLLTVIVILQGVYFFVDFSSEEISINENELFLFNKEIDSLRLVELEKQKPKIYPFNPNFITDYKGYTLGMSNQEIDRLLAYRKQNKWINSAKDFQQVTKVSNSLLKQISPYFKFPEWVIKPKTSKANIYKNNSYSKQPKTFQQKIDLNTATAIQLQKINGIGEALSNRIVNFRNKQGGFIANVQLQEVYGLKPEVILRITNEFTVKTPKPIAKINLNQATRDQLVTIPYIDYELAHAIIEQRTLREGFKDFAELTKVKDFPVAKIEIIKLYLTLN